MYAIPCTKMEISYDPWSNQVSCNINILFYQITWHITTQIPGTSLNPGKWKDVPVKFMDSIWMRKGIQFSNTEVWS
jgi:hypothetical protein